MKPKLLFLCQNLPYPPDGGALIRSYHTLRLLSGSYDVTALCFDRPDLRTPARPFDGAIDALSRFARVEAFTIAGAANPGRRAWDHLRSVATGKVYTRWIYESKRFRTRLRQLLAAEGFALVHMDSLDLAGYLGEVRDTPVVVAHHNVESSLLARRAASEHGPRRVYMAWQAQLTRRLEASWCGRVAMNVVVSEEDRRQLAEIAPEAEYLVVPNGVDTRAFRPEPVDEPRGLVFVGGHTWYPNRDGMEYFATEILPILQSRIPDVRVTWVGRAPEDVRRSFKERGIEMTGYVEDIRPYVNRAAVYIVPIRVGGGTRLKVLDAWALGKAVVSTPAGAEGLDVKEGENMVVRDSPASFADAVEELLSDPVARRHLEKGGRHTAESRYDWGVIGSIMLSSFAGIARNTSRADLHGAT